jgi:hypothetical protein
VRKDTCLGIALRIRIEEVSLEGEQAEEETTEGTRRTGNPSAS